MEQQKLETLEVRKEQAELKLGLTPDVKRVLETLRSLREPEGLTKVVNYASDVLDKQDGTEALIKELLQIEVNIKTSSAVLFGGLATFLERNGIVPLGSVEYEGYAM